MSEKGNCWDNAVAESFFGSLKREAIYHYRFATKSQAKACIFDYVEAFYNRFRLHSALNYLMRCIRFAPVRLFDFVR
ncbi:MAG: IS3 family transposase [Candidatus Obscuribacterales bacterium]|nr:IS3 family transposase [Candidatus Obscuribacterales bacterium]